MVDLFFTRKTGALILLLIVISVGFYIRYDNLSFWHENKSRYFSPSDNTPLTLNIDSYYYLDIAKDALQGNIEKLDHQRQTPNWYEKPISLPLLSLTLAFVSKVSGKPLEWGGILIPPFLGVLLGIPVYLLAVLLFRTSSYATTNGNTQISATIAGLTAALFALISPAFVERSSIGWCDTDILNVTLLCSITLVSLHIAIAKNTRELVLSLIIFTLLTGFFLQWWDQATAPVTAFSLGYLCLAGLFSITRQRNNAKFFIAFLALICLILWGLRGEFVLQIPKNILNMISYSFSSDTKGVNFFNPGKLVAEQQDVSFTDLATKIAGNEGIFCLAIFGILLLGLVTRKYFLFLLPWLALSYLATKSHRLIIFPGVLFGLGIGTVVFLVCTYLKKLNFIKLLPVLIAIIAIAWFPYTHSQSYFSRTPKNSPWFFDAIKTISKVVPVDSTIWSSWGHGHPLVFYTDAKTIGDGIYHPPVLVYSQYFPYTVSNPRLAANWIAFYSIHGQEGLRKANQVLTGRPDNWAKGVPAVQVLMGSGIEKSREILTQQYTFSPQEIDEFLTFLYPSPPSPVYFLLDYSTFEEQWFPWGRINFNEPGKKISYTMVPFRAPFQSGNILKGKSTLGVATFDLAKGVGRIGDGGMVYLKQIRIDTGNDLFTKRYKDSLPMSSSFYSLLLNQNKYMSFGALMDNNVLDTIFTKMFFLKEYDEQFFQPVMQASPLLSLYRVKGDVYRKNE